jgi:hypothetical protein
MRRGGTTGLKMNLKAELNELSLLLSGDKWKEADEKTHFILCEVSGRGERKFIDPEAISKLPFNLIKYLNNVWFDESGKKFGFGIQSAIWSDVGGSPKIFNYLKMSKEIKIELGGIEVSFARRVGWKKTNEWGEWQGCNYDGSLMRQGALPYQCHMCSYGTGLTGINLAAIAWRYQQLMVLEKMNS